jgi:PAS domain S-box-containing protein
MGYGDPPRDPARLRELAATDGVGVKELRELAEAYQPRPAFLVELANRRLLSSARLIGDIVERKQREEALCRSEARFKTLAEVTSDWLWEVDENGVYTYSSPKVRELLGYEPEEVIGKTPFDFMRSPERERVARIFHEAMQSAAPWPPLRTSASTRTGRRWRWRPAGSLSSIRTAAFAVTGASAGTSAGASGPRKRWRSGSWR